MMLTGTRYVLVSLLLLINYSSTYEQDFKCSAADDSCHDVHHTVIKLYERDDELARRIACEHDMVVKGKPFLESHYFLYHSDEERSASQKRQIHERLESHPEVESLSTQIPRKRVKRDYASETENAVVRMDMLAWLMDNVKNYLVPSFLDDVISL